jgi:hypothetical protein
MPETKPQEIEDPIKDHLVCYQQIPLCWRRLDQALSDSEHFNIHNDNARLMEVLVGSEDVRDIEATMDKDSMKEIKKLDAKLNLLMGWIGQLLQQQQHLPPAQMVCLSSRGLQFQSDDSNAGALREEDKLYIEMFLEPSYPQAFTAVSEVVKVNPQVPSPGVEIVARFTELSEQNQLWLDKYVFQLHRRQVALSRKHPQ